jgi:hypothetical protein
VGQAAAAGSSIWYGLQASRAIGGEEVVRAVVDVPATAQTRIRPAIAWEGTTAGAAPWVTAVHLCGLPLECDLAPEARRWTTMAAAGRVDFHERPSFTTDSAALRVTVDSARGRLLRVDLPRPL